MNANTLAKELAHENIYFKSNFQNTFINRFLYFRNLEILRYPYSLTLTS